MHGVEEQRYKARMSVNSMKAVQENKRSASSEAVKNNPITASSQLTDKTIDRRDQHEIKKLVKKEVHLTLDRDSVCIFTCERIFSDDSSILSRS
jgi:hypothetical protein